MSQQFPQGPRQVPAYRPPPQLPHQPNGSERYPQPLTTALGGLAVVLIVFCVIGVVSASVASLQASRLRKSLPPTSVYPTTSANTPTATPTGPRPLTGTTLGGTRDAFTATYGAPYQDWGTGGYFHGTASGIQVTIRVEFATGSDGKPHVSNVHISMPDYPNTMIPSSKADVIAAAFLPPDSTHIRDGTDSLDHSVLHIYQSNALAATFPASKFTDTHHQPIPPGTLTIEDVLPDGNQPGVLYTSIQLSQY